MNRLIVPCPWLVVFASWVCTIGVASPPDVTFTTPLGVMPGKSNELIFHGKDLGEATQIWTPCATETRVVASEKPTEDAKAVQAILNVPDNIPVGIYAARLATRDGVSPAVLLMVDDLPSTNEAGKHQTRETAQEIATPIAVDGAGDGASHDYYCFDATAGQWFTIEVVSARLGYAFDARLRVFDEGGRDIVETDDTPGLSGDCRVRFQAAHTQRYFIEVGDAAFSSSARHKYRLRIGDFPLVTTTWPLGITAVPLGVQDTKQDQPSLAFCQVADTPMPPTASVNWFSEQSPSVAIAARFRSGAGSCMARYTVSSLRNYVCPMDVANDSSEAALALEVPIAINHILRQAGRSHYYRLKLSSGKGWRFQGLTRSLGSPADIFLKVYAPDGQLLASGDDAGLDEATVDIQAKQDGEYLLVVQEINGRHGDECSYRIEVTEIQPGFDLSAKAERIIIGQGGVGLLPIECRRSGYKGPIRLEIVGPDAPFELENHVIAADKTATLLRLVPKGDLQPGDLRMIRIAGRGEADGQQLMEYVNVVDEIRAQRPALAYPPGEMWDWIAVGMARPLSEFFGLRLATSTIQFPRIVGEAYFTVFCTDRTEGFTDAIHLEAVDLPAGFSVSGHDKPVGNSKNSEYRFALSGPKDLTIGSHLVTIHATGTFQGQVKEVKIEDVPLQVIDPLILSLAIVPTDNQADPEVVLRATAKRFVARGGGDRKEIRCQWKSRPAWLQGADAFVIEAGKNEATLRLKVAADAATNASKVPLVFAAVTSVQGQDVQVESEPLELELPTSENP